MSEYKEVILPLGGMNSDDSYNTMPEGDYPPFAIGMRSGVLGTGNNNSVENIKGTNKLNHILPPGENTCVGWCRDYENNGIIYLISNSNDIHSIVQYIPATNTFNSINNSIFGFNKNHKINHIDKIGDLLYWTNNYNPPRKINLKKAFNNEYVGIDEQVIDVIKYPYVKSPVANFYTDMFYKKNNLNGKMFQFAIRYVYDDYEKSCWSPVSKTPLRLTPDEMLDGNNVFDITKNNYIGVGFNTGHHTIIKIEIAAREGNIGDWFLIDKVEKYDNQGNILVNSNFNYFYRFYNDKQSEALDQADNARLFDYVPQLAGCQSVIEKNMLTYSDVTEGYDNTEIDVNLSFERELKAVSSSVNLTIQSTFTYTRVISLFNTTFIAGKIFTLNIVNTDPAADVNYTIVETYLPTDSSPTSFLDRIVATINLLEFSSGSGTYYTATYAVNLLNGGYNLTININTGTPTITQFMTCTISEGNTKYKNWLPGVLEFGIIYYDRGNRSNAVSTSNGSLINVVDYSETVIPLTVITDRVYVNTINWEIHSKPPIWATHYQWAYYRHQLWTKFLEIPINDISKTAGGFIEIDINTNIVAINTTNKKSVISAYVWQKGDRIRFIKKKPTGNFNTFDYIQEVLDFEINGQDSTTGKIQIDNFDYNYYAINEDTIVRIYTPRKELQQKIFFEFGEVGEIGNAGATSAYHKKIGNIGQDQTSVLPAKGTFDSGDSYARARWTPKYVFSCYAQDYSDWYNSRVTDIGRPNAIIEDMRRLRLEANIRRGGVLIEDTKTNGMSTFKENDYIKLTAKYGAINKTVYRGFTLKIYQTFKVTPIYINRSSQTDVSGKESLIFADKVMTVGNAPNEEWGTDLPNSVVTFGNSIYFFDRHISQWIWDAGNGLIPVNDKMNKYFKDISNKNKLDVVAWVNEYSELIATFSFQRPSEGEELSRDIISETIMLNIPQKKWKTFLPFYKTDTVFPEMYGGTDNYFVSWINGEIYLHNVGQYNNFFSTYHKQTIPIIANNGLKSDKIFQTIEVVSTDIYDSPTDGDIFIMDEDALPSGMKSRLKAGQYKWREGKYVAGFMRDVNTPSTIPNKIINGRVLRGKVLCCKLHNNSNNLVILKSVTIKGITSELNS